MINVLHVIINFHSFYQLKYFVLFFFGELFGWRWEGIETRSSWLDFFSLQ